MPDLYVILWAVVGAAALVGEVLTISFFLVFFSLGAVVGLLLALAGLGPFLQVAGFILASVFSMFILRPALLNRLALRGGEVYVGQKSIAGQGAVVTMDIEPGGSGTIRVGGGEYWTARSLDAGERIEQGARVRVLDTDGLTALVETVDV